MRSAIAALKARCDVASNPYFTALRSGDFSRDDFVETQVQFLFAVVFFSRPMAVLAGRLPRPEMRLALLENVHDEHGEGNLSVSHERTFLALLAALGVGPADIDARALWPEVRAFNTALGGLCFADDCFTGLAALGIIEDLFAGISARLGRGILDRGWLRPEALVHYSAHEQLDVSHADGFYRVIEGPFAAHPRYAYQITQGLELGAYIFLRMYEDLYRARARRWTREVRGPHSLAEGWHLEGVPGGGVV